MLFVDLNTQLESPSFYMVHISTTTKLPHHDTIWFVFSCFSFKRQEAGELKQNRFERPDFRIGKQSADHDGRGRVFETGNGWGRLVQGGTLRPRHLNNEYVTDDSKTVIVDTLTVVFGRKDAWVDCHCQTDKVIREWQLTIETTWWHLTWLSSCGQTVDMDRTTCH